MNNTPSHHSPRLAFAKLSVDDNGLPSATDYEDSYFSRENGLAETRHVFINGNHLTERWSHTRQFTIAETGFGTGLNFLATCQAWLNHGNPDGWLHFVSTELHPIQLATLKSLHQQWPELAPFAAALQAQWPPAHRGYHRLLFPQWRISLTLLYGDASQTLAQLNASVNAWFLDGFAPNRNQGLWNDALYQQIAKLTAAGGSFATYTAAGHVRRGLALAGFDVKKVTGYAHKRHMSIGTLSQAPSLATPSPAIKSPKKISVIGAGIAGATVARAFAERGVQVTVYEQASHPAAEASGVPAGLVRPWPELQRSVRERYYEAAFLLSRNRLLATQDEAIYYQNGVEQAFDQAQRAVTIAARGFDNTLLTHQLGKLIYPHALTVNPARWCQWLLKHPNIEWRRQHPIDNSPAALEALAKASITILCGGWRMAEASTPSQTRLQFVRGQAATIQHNHSASSPSACRHGHVLPLLANPTNSLVGSSFVPNNSSCEFSDAEHESVVKQLVADGLLPNQPATYPAQNYFANVRLAANDRMPIVGRLSSPNEPPLYTSTAHGSRGLTGASLAAEILCGLLLNEPACVESDLIEAVSPNRFAMRASQLRNRLP